MAFLNLQKREIECKIVYYGPGRSGKTTNLEQIHRSFRQNVNGQLVSIDTEGDRTLFFDFLAIGLGSIGGCNVRVHLYTVPGQVRYRSTRKLVLHEADGVVFVADSLEVRREKNLISLSDLEENLNDFNRSISEIPLVLQYNKRDLSGQDVPLLSVMTLEDDLNRQLRAPYFEASAIHGHGVGPTLKSCLKITLSSLQKQMKWMESRAQGERGRS